MGACLLSSFLLFRTRYACEVFDGILVFIFMRVLMIDFGMFRLTSLYMECLCIAPLTPVVMTMRGLIFHPLFCMVLISGSYSVCLCVRVSLET